MPNTKHSLLWLVGLATLVALLDGTTAVIARPLVDTQPLPSLDPQPFYQGHDFTALVAQTSFPAGTFASTVRPGDADGALGSADAGEWQLILQPQDATHGFFVLRQSSMVKSQGSYRLDGHRLLLEYSGTICPLHPQQAVYRWSFMSGQLSFSAVTESSARRRATWERVWQFRNEEQSSLVAIQQISKGETLTLVQGESEALTVETDDNLLPYIKTTFLNTPPCGVSRHHRPSVVDCDRGRAECTPIRLSAGERRRSAHHLAGQRERYGAVRLEVFPGGTQC